MEAVVTPVLEPGDEEWDGEIEWFPAEMKAWPKWKVPGRHVTSVDFFDSSI
jgi:hypothetical protein